MDLGAYFIRITGAALLSSSLGMILPGKGTLGNVLKLMRSGFMVLCLLTPLTGFRPGQWQDWLEDFETEGSHLAAQGENSSRLAMEDIISRQVRTYIQDKAATLGATVRVDVRLSADAMPVPCGVTVTGNLSPYAKAQLSDYISSALGITQEAQIWLQS